MKSIENHSYLKRMLFPFQHKLVTFTSKDLNEFNKIFINLHNLDAKILDEDKFLLLLNSQLDLHEYLTINLLYEKSEIRFVDASDALMKNEYRQL